MLPTPLCGIFVVFIYKHPVCGNLYASKWSELRPHVDEIYFETTKAMITRKNLDSYISEIERDFEISKFGGNEILCHHAEQNFHNLPNF